MDILRHPACHRSRNWWKENVIGVVPLFESKIQRFPFPVSNHTWERIPVSKWWLCAQSISGHVFNTCIIIYIYHYISLSLFQFQSLKGLSWLNTTEQHQHIPRPRSAGALHASKKKGPSGARMGAPGALRYFAHWKRRCLSSMVIVQTHVSGPCPSAPACWDSAVLSQNSPLIFNVQ